MIDKDAAAVALGWASWRAVEADADEYRQTADLPPRHTMAVTLMLLVRSLDGLPPSERLMEPELP